MKKTFTNFLLSLLMLWAIDGSAQIFVNYLATGNNDGTSWADAFTDLQDALSIAQDGDQIWVAEGTYLPGSDPTATFLIDKNLHLYGGFAGTETTLAERGEPASHPALLSGDLNGDDVEDDFVHNKSDNVMTVVTVGDNATGWAVIDGFTIQGGQADGDYTADDQVNGGGLVSYGSPTVRNCRFTQNFAVKDGGAAWLFSTSINFEGCVFSKNKTYGKGGALWCDIPEFVSGTMVNVAGCTFEYNIGSSGGGGFYCYASGSNSDLTFFDSTIRENVSSSDFNSGGGGFVDLRGDSSSLLVDNCHFSSNAGDQGGAFYSRFSGNETSVILKNSTFTDNTAGIASTGYGIANITGWGAGNSALVDSCLFENNFGWFNGGLRTGSAIAGSSSDFTISNCSFLNNQAYVCGGLEIFGTSGTSPNFTVENCLVEGNTATIRAGGFMIGADGSDLKATLRNCRILDNQSPAGGAVDFVMVFDGGNYIVTPAFSPEAELIIENCLIAGNSSDNAVISVDSFPGFKMFNCTVEGNTGGGIGLSNQSGLTLRNTILYNNGSTEFEALTNDVTVTSLGGNLIGDGSFAAHAIGSDLQDADPMFNGAGDDCEYYLLSDGSPAKNNGVEWPDAPALDACGNPRVQDGQIDIGALEGLYVSAKEIIAGEIGLSPNPATDFLNIEVPETIAQSVEIIVFDLNGKLVKSQMMATGQPMGLEGLAAGMYLVKTVVDERVYTGKFSKF